MRVFIVGLLLLGQAGCQPDRGECLQGHTVQRRHRAHQHVTLVCDQWEFPEGRKR